MYSADTVKRSLQYLYRGTVFKCGNDSKTVERLLKRLNFAALAAAFSQRTKRVYAYQTWG